AGDESQTCNWTCARRRRSPHLTCEGMVERGRGRSLRSEERGTKVGPPPAATSDESCRLSERLDEALMETFPASDPIAVTPTRRLGKHGPTAAFDQRAG